LLGNLKLGYHRFIWLLIFSDDGTNNGIKKYVSEKS
jgi:hypothetical protein